MSAKAEQEGALLVLDVSKEAEAERKEISAHVKQLLEKGLEEAEREGDVDPGWVAEARAMHDALQREIALQQILVRCERLMLAAQKLYGWTTVERVQACLAGVQAGDPEAERQFEQLVELVESGGGGGDDAS